MKGNGQIPGKALAPESSSPAFQVIVLGSGGGPLEDNATGLLVRSMSTQWEKNSVLAVDIGVHLSSIVQIFRDQCHVNGTTDETPSQATSEAKAERGESWKPPTPKAGSSSLTVSPDRPILKSILQEGPLKGFELAHSDPIADALHFLRHCISTYLITHPHLDHIAGGMINTASFTQPKRMAALPSTIDALKIHIFNDIIWPNLTDEDGGVGLLTFMRLADGGNVVLAESSNPGYIEICEGLSVKSWSISHGHCMRKHDHQTTLSRSPSNHGRRPSSSPSSHRRNSIIQLIHSDTGQTVSTSIQDDCVYDSTAYFIRDSATGKELLIFGDVEPDSISLAPRNERVWSDAAPKIASGTLAGILIECSYEDSRPDDILFGHLAPRHLIAELKILAEKVDRIKTETKTLKRKRRLDDTDTSPRTKAYDEGQI